MCLEIAELIQAGADLFPREQPCVVFSAVQLPTSTSCVDAPKVS
jgi:hypothetical protein